MKNKTLKALDKAKILCYNCKLHYNRLECLFLHSQDLPFCLPRRGILWESRTLCRFGITISLNGEMINGQCKRAKAWQEHKNELLEDKVYA